jgi:N-acetylneuraminic acid mutarotase
MRHLVIVGMVAACGGGGGTTGDAGGDASVTGCETTTPWAAAPPVTRGPTQETAAVATGGKIYVLGGFDGSLAVIDAVQIFDPAACTWSTGPALPKQVHHANAAVVDGTIYVLGAMQTASFTTIGDVWSWNPETETAWTVRASMPAGTQRGASVAGAIDGKIYVAGGLRNGAIADFGVYDPAQDMWSPLPALPAARDHGCGAAIGGKLYVVGGRQAQITSIVPTVFEYTPGGAWAERAAMPTARGGTACGVIDDRLIVVGGEGNTAANSGVFPQVESYDPGANTWTPLAPMTTPRHGMAAAAIGGRLYVPGGATQQGFGAVATHEVLTP